MKQIVLLTALSLFCMTLVLFSCTSSPTAFEESVRNQPVVFKVPNNKADVVWKRVPVYLHNMKHLYSGGAMQQNDTVVFVPYLPGLGFNKGNSIRATRRIEEDSTLFSTAWYYYDETDTLAAKELAFYMLTGIDRYDK